MLRKGDDPKSKSKCRIKRSLAKQLVAAGKAVWIEKYLIAQSTEEIPKSNGIKSRDRHLAAISELKGIRPVFFQGGLTRTETNPAPFEHFKAARVGHQ